MKITLRQLQEGAKLSLGDCLKMEYRLTQRCMVSIIVLKRVTINADGGKIKSIENSMEGPRSLCSRNTTKSKF